ncbi:MAG: type III-B CRISPR-associated protein Cas10/Cmr2 [Verrucomicrobiales bacterium]|nr:type III-B CRISPR-associated protein Cas10/Cmr2 [Verrucomicrobiales bacterium]
MLAVAKETGPDAIIYPQLRGVPLADWSWHKQGILPRELIPHRNELQTPNLPNRFLAVIPQGWSKGGKSLPQIAKDAVRDAWTKIAGAVHADIVSKLKAKAGEFPDWDMFWDEQVDRFPVVDYIVHDWLPPEQAIRQAETLATPPLKDGWQNHPLHHAVLWAREMIRPEHRDARCYKHEPWKEGMDWKSQLLDANGQPLAPGALPAFDNAGLVWALNYALADWKFAAAKNARAFKSWDVGNPQPGRGVPKDHLDGRCEVLGGPTKGLDEENPDNPNNRFWAVLREAYGGEARGGFKGKQKYGAVSVIKRLYPRVWMEKALGIHPPRFESVEAIADAIDREESDPPADKEPTYYAILCMDGDDLGQWVNGTKTPPLLKVLAGTEADEKSPKGYFKKHWQPAKAGGIQVGAVRRPLTPGFHAALSEALGNFSLYCAGQVVKAFKGQLLYSGGDDVLAMLPAKKAVECAQALQLTFRGLDPEKPQANASRLVQRVLKWTRDNPDGLFEFPADGFVTCKRAAGEGEHLRPNWPLMVMGLEATASVGIAIGHVRSPMQDTIQAARDAEHTAKSVPGKAAVCLSVLKRSGESAQFAAKWNSGVTGV